MDLEGNSLLELYVECTRLQGKVMGHKKDQHLIVMVLTILSLTRATANLTLFLLS